MKETIAVDADGILCDFLGPALADLQRRTGLRIKRHEVKDFHYLDIYEQWDDCCKSLLKDFDRLSNLQPIPYALWGMKELGKHFNLVVVTARPDYCEKATFAWLEKHKVKVQGVIHTHDKLKAMARGGMTRIIEDKRQMAVAAAEAGYRSYLLSYSHNRGHHEGVIRCQNWKAVVGAVLNG